MIQNGKVVYLKYSLKSSDGEVLDEADSNDPFIYLHGAHQIVPGLENALNGLNLGDKKKVSVEPQEGYGIVDPKLRMAVNRSQFPSDVEIEEGMQFHVDTDDGEGMLFTVVGLENDKVRVDGNHPLAGHTLHFDVEVLKIRDATEEEVSHGHAHDGHHHHHDHDDHDHDHDHDHHHNH